MKKILLLSVGGLCLFNPLTTSKSEARPNLERKFRARIRQKFVKTHKVRTLIGKQLSAKQGLSYYERRRFGNLLELGRLLYFDKILSGNKNISCATCHYPSMGTGDLLPFPIGEGGHGVGTNREVKNGAKNSQGHIIPRNAPPVYNRGIEGQTAIMWDGRINLKNGLINTPEGELNSLFPNIAKELKSILAVQALFPISSHEEMRGSGNSNPIAKAKDIGEVWSLLTKRVTSTPKYKKLILAAFGPGSGPINMGHLANAIGAYESVAFRASNTAFDRFLKGDLMALNSQQLQGAKIFLGKGQCIKCHNGSFLTDFKTHNIGVPQFGPGKGKPGVDRGLEEFSNNPNHQFQFRTPGLRNVELTAPYMHNGLFTSLEDAVLFHSNPKRYYDRYRYGQDQMHGSPFNNLTSSDDNLKSEILNSLDPIYSNLSRGKGLSRREAKLVVSFLTSLTDHSSLEQPWGGIPDEVPSGLPVKN